VPARSAEPAAAAAGQRWLALIDEMDLAGLVRELALNCALVTQDEGRLRLALDPQVEQMLNPRLEQRLAEAVKEKYGAGVALEIKVDAAEAAATPAALAAAAAAQRQRDAEQAIESDTTVQAMKDMFDARVDQVTVKP
ncbi:MAG: hypothetical protein KJO38_05210, partial [Gammaproteobacteria bacterium]|nr:hypothetical protein [Gammaproteobacteria bacterium]